MIEIRSYRAVFDLERRIYRVDQLRLNPGGIPVRGVIYFLAILLVMLLAGSLPLAGAAIGALPWYLRDLALPIASATVLSVIRIEGRPFHLAAYALLRYRIESRRPIGDRPAGLRPCNATDVRWRPEEILLLPDGSDGGMRRLRYTGPGAVLITTAHERIDRGRGPGGRSLTVRELPGGCALPNGQVIALAHGVRLDVRSAAVVPGDEVALARVGAPERRSTRRRRRR